MNLDFETSLRKTSTGFSNHLKISSQSIECIVLAGGKGERLSPLTQECAKPLIPFGGKYRLIDIPLSNAFHSEIQNINVLTQYRACSLNHYVAKVYSNRFQKGHVRILSPEERNNQLISFKGTADAVRKNIEYLKQSSSNYFLILSADHLYKIDFRDMLNQFIEKNADVMIAAKEIPYEFTSRMGILSVDTNFQIINFCEKPSNIRDYNHFQYGGNGLNDSYLASMGIYLFKKDVLISTLESTDHLDFGKDIIPKLIHSHSTYAYHYSGYWVDIGTIRSFFDANMELLKSNSPLSFYDETTPIYFQHAPLPPTKLIEATISFSVTCDGSEINGAKINSCLIGPKTYIGASHLDSCYVIGGNDYPNSLPTSNKNFFCTHIGSNCKIHNAIIDKNVHISDNVQLVNKENHSSFDDKYLSIRDGIIIVKKGSHIPKGYSI